MIKFDFFKRLSLVLFVLPICFLSCQEDFLKEQANEHVIIPDDLVDNNLQLKSEFAKALAIVLDEHQEARSFIKNEALKKFDHDYDVLYDLIKDEKLNCGLTLEEMLSKHMSAEKLTQVKEQIPTLTIFVPELPENSFSAEIWETDNDAPFVGVRVRYDNNVPMYDAMGNKTILPADRIPTYPVLIIKENERVVASNEASSLGIMSRSIGGQKFAFIDSVFDNVSQRIYQGTLVTTTDNITGVYEKTTTDSRGNVHKTVVPESLRKILDAYDVYNGRNGWQRDYIYYNLTPTRTQGPFHYNIKECIMAFEMVGNADACLAKISDQDGDPRRNGNNIYGSRRGGGTYWTDGEFEFKVKVYVGNKNSFGTELISYFRVNPTHLFALKYIRDRNNSQNMEITGVNNIRAYLETPLPLFEWDLETYSANVKIAIEEVDATEVVKQAIETTSEFATNFSFSSTFGAKVKTGLQFGASNKETRKTTYECSTTYGNDELGETIINFADDVIINREIFGKPNYDGDTPRTTVGETSSNIIEGTLDFNGKYQTGWYKIFIAPVKMN